MRTFTTTNPIIIKYVKEKEKYTEETRPVIDEMTEIQKETEKITEEAKAKIEKLSKRMSKLNEKQTKLAKDFLKKKKKALPELRKLEMSNRSHKYEQLTHTKIKDKAVHCTMRDVLEEKTKELKKMLDDEEKKREKDIPV